MSKPNFQPPGQQNPTDQNFPSPDQHNPTNQDFPPPGQRNPTNQDFPPPGQQNTTDQNFPPPGQQNPSNKNFSPPAKQKPTNQNFPPPTQQNPNQFHAQPGQYMPQQNYQYQPPQMGQPQNQQPQMVQPIAPHDQYYYQQQQGDQYYVQPVQVQQQGGQYYAQAPVQQQQGQYYQQPAQQRPRQQFPVATPPVQGNVATPTLALQAWSTELFDCGQDMENTIITLCCPCITFGQIAEITDRGMTSCSSAGLIYVMLFYFTGLHWVYSWLYRTKLRMQYSLVEDPCHDCLVHLFCEYCSLCQQYRELKNRGFNVELGWIGNMQLQAQRRAAAQVVGVAPQVQGMTR